MPSGTTAGSGRVAIRGRPSRGCRSTNEALQAFGGRFRRWWRESHANPRDRLAPDASSPAACRTEPGCSLRSLIGLQHCGKRGVRQCVRQSTGRCKRRMMLFRSHAIVSVCLRQFPGSLVGGRFKVSANGCKYVSHDVLSHHRATAGTDTSKVESYMVLRIRQITEVTLGDGSGWLERLQNRCIPELVMAGSLSLRQAKRYARRGLACPAAPWGISFAKVLQLSTASKSAMPSGTIAGSGRIALRTGRNSGCRFAVELPPGLAGCCRRW